MTAPSPYARKWADNDLAPEPVPTVLVSSRDGAPVPVVRGAVALVRVAEAAGWTARQAYALADVPAATSRKTAHRMASISVRLERGAARIWAAWYSVNDGPWRFDCAYAGPDRLWLIAGKANRPTLAARLAVTP